MGLLKQILSKSTMDDNERYDLYQSPTSTSAYQFYKNNNYENAYGSIRAIVNHFMVIQPYAIDQTGKTVAQSNVINRLYHPNKQMSSIAFREALAVMSLVMPKVYILVWRNEGGVAKQGGQITPNNIAGFTFLQGVSENKIGDEIHYSCNGKNYSENEVIVIKNINPYNLSDGFSAADAAKRWSRLDDYISDYQAGFFSNGAVPSGQFVITAATKQDFNDIVDRMKSRHRGAGKNNNVTYVHRPIDLNTGKVAEAQIEWIPFNQSNKDLSLKDLFDQVNKKIDSTYGVPASIRAVNDNNTYASVRVDEEIFVRETVNPFTLKIWTNFTHELNRITGGLGVAITYDIEFPHIADEEKVEAEKKQVEMNIINTMVSAGYELPSIIEAFDLDEDYMNLKVAKVEVNEDQPDVDTGEEVNDSPNDVDNKQLKEKRLSEEEKSTFEYKMAEVARKFMEKQIDTAIINATSKAVNTDQEKDNEAFTDEMLVVCVSAMVANGEIQYAQGIKILEQSGLDTSKATEFLLNDLNKNSYREYLINVAQSYTDETAKSIRDVLARAEAQGWNKSQIETGLKNIMNTDDYRVTRLSVSEINRSQEMAGLEAMKQIESETGYQLVKVWTTTNPGACEFCQALNGQEVKLDSNFVPIHGIIDGVDGGVYVNDFVDMSTSQAHPNCTCATTYKVVK